MAYFVYIICHQEQHLCIMNPIWILSNQILFLEFTVLFYLSHYTWTSLGVQQLCQLGHLHMGVSITSLEVPP